MRDEWGELMPDEDAVPPDDDETPTVEVEFTLPELLVLMNTACFGALVALSPSDPAIPELLLKLREALTVFESERWNDVLCRMQRAAQAMPGGEMLDMAVKFLEHRDVADN